MLFMPGFGTGAHIFDSIAPAFTGHFHVAALTPRGFPPSDAPATGYTIAQLASDARVVIDSLGGGSAVLIAHSISGAVITSLGTTDPDKLLAAIYLDAAFDFGDAHRRSQSRPISGPPATADTSAASYRAWRANYPVTDAIREQDGKMWDIDSADAARRWSLVAPLADEVRSRRHEPWRVRAPTLIVCPVTSLARGAGWLTPDSARWITAVTYQAASERQKRAECADLGRRLAHGTVVVVESGHFVFLDRRAEVIEAMQGFLTPIVNQVEAGQRLTP